MTETYISGNPDELEPQYIAYRNMLLGLNARPQATTQTPNTLVSRDTIELSQVQTRPVGATALSAAERDPSLATTQPLASINTHRNAPAAVSTVELPAYNSCAVPTSPAATRSFQAIQPQHEAQSRIPGPIAATPSGRVASSRAFNRDEVAGGRYVIPMDSAEPSIPWMRALRAEERERRVEAQNKAFANEIKARNVEIDGLVTRFIASGAEGLDLQKFAPDTDPYIIEMAKKQLEARRTYVRSVLRGVETPVNTLPYLDENHRRLSEQSARRQAQSKIEIFAGNQESPLTKMAERARVDWDALEDRLTAFYVATSASNPSRGLVHHELAGYLAEVVDNHVHARLKRTAEQAAVAKAVPVRREAIEVKAPVAATFEEESENQPHEPLVPRLAATARSLAESANQNVRRMIAGIRDKFPRDGNQPPAPTRIYPNSAAQERQANTAAIPDESAALEQITGSLRNTLALGQKALNSLPPRPNPRVGNILWDIRGTSPQAAQALRVVQAKFAQQGIPLWRALTKCIEPATKLSDAVVANALVQELLSLAGRQNLGQPAMAVASRIAQPQPRASRAARSYPAQRSQGARTAVNSYPGRRDSASTSGSRRQVTDPGFEASLIGERTDPNGPNWMN